MSLVAGTNCIVCQMLQRLFKGTLTRGTGASLSNQHFVWHSAVNCLRMWQFKFKCQLIIIIIIYFLSVLYNVHDNNKRVMNNNINVFFNFS